MKLLPIILIMLLIGIGTCATENTYNLTESQLKEIIDISREGGNAETSRLWGSSLFEMGIISHSEELERNSKDNAKAVLFNEMMRILFGSDGWRKMVEDY